MGLDIFAIEKAVRVDEYDGDIEKLSEESNVVRVKQVGDFKAHDHITSGIYRWDGRSMDFRAGSYSTYNGFRSDLCIMAHGVFPQVLWKNPELYEGGEFYELIHFSDCEGAIGPTTAQKLLNDFKKYRDHYCEDSNAWDCEVYDYWIESLKIASNDGMLIFC